MMRVCLVTLVAGSSALQPACVGHCHAKSGARYTRLGTPTMDETILEKALRGELEEEGAENVFMSEVGWASYLDKEAGQSYNMNERVSKAKDGYFTPDLFSNPIDVATSWVQSMVRVAEDPLASSFMTISNDKGGARSWGEFSEVKSRTIKPKEKDFDADKRV